MNLSLSINGNTVRYIIVTFGIITLLGINIYTGFIKDSSTIVDVYIEGNNQPIVEVVGAESNGHSESQLESALNLAWEEIPVEGKQAIKENLPEKYWKEFALVTWCESRWNTKAHNTNNENSKGPFQINVVSNANPTLDKKYNLFSWVGGSLAASELMNTPRGILNWSCAHNLEKEANTFLQSHGY